MIKLLFYFSLYSCMNASFCLFGYIDCMNATICYLFNY